MNRFYNKLKDLSLIGIADIFSSGISAVFWFYIATIIEPNEYGKISYFLSIASLSSSLSLLGSANTLVVYTAKNIKIQATLYFLTIISGLIASLVIFLIFYNLGTSLLVFGYVMFTLVTSELLGRKLFQNYSKYIITQKILMISLALGFFYLIGENGILIGIGLSFTIYLIGIINEFRNSKVNFKLIKVHSRFMINSYLQTVLGSINNSVDKLIIAPVVGFALLGNYALGLQYYNMMLLIPSIIGKYLLPHDSTGYKNRKLRYVTVLFAGLLTVLGVTIGPEIISMFFPKFDSVENVIRIISLSLIPSVIVIIFHNKFLGEEKSRKALFSSSIWTGTQIIGIVILGNTYGITGVSISLVISSIVSATYSILANKFERI